MNTPLKIDPLHKLAVDEMLKHVREAEPIKPSSRIWDERDTKVGQDTATHRMTNPSRLHRIVRGELDWILLKALEKENAELKKMYAEAMLGQKVLKAALEKKL